MTIEEVIDLLATAAAYDRRTVGEADVVAWHRAVADLDFLDAQDAVVGHYTETTDWLMPAHVRKRVKDIRAGRLNRQPIPAPPAELTDMPSAYKQAVQDAVAKMARGYALPKQITARVEPPEEYTEARGGDHHRLRMHALQVACPWEACKALPGTVCIDAFGNTLTTPAHEARLRAIGLLDADRPASAIEGA